MFGKSWEMIKRGMAVALSVSLLAGAMSVSSSLPTAAASTKRVEVGTKGNVTINLDGREVWQAAADAMQKAQPVTGDIADRIMAQTGSNGNPVVLEDDIYKMELPAKALKGLPTGLGMEMYISAGAEDVAEDYTAAEEGEAAAVVAEVASASDLEATGVAEKPVRDFFASSMFSLIKENDEAAPAGGAAAAGGEGYELNGSEHIYFVLSNATDQDVNYTVKLGDLEILKTKVLKSHGDTTGVIGASVSDLIGVPASTSNMVRATESDMATASNLMEEAELTDDVVAKVVRTTLKNFFIIYRSEETALGTKAMVVTTADMKFKSKDGGVFTTRGDKMVLAVRDIDKNSEEYKQAAATLQNNNVDHADFAAVDISFRKGGADEDYEPCQGQIVNVRIETKAIENFDPESMSIQHHLDDGSLETVAGTTKKTVVEISDDAAEAVNNTVAVTEDQQTEITVEKKEDENVYTFDEEANKAAMEAQLSTAGKSEFKMEVGDGETALTNDVKESGAPKKASAAQTEVKKNSVTKTISSAVDANGVKTEVQEEQGNGDIKVEDGKVVADFVVDSFSIYTIVGQEINTVDYLSPADGNTYRVSVDLRNVTNIPEGAELVVEEVAQSEYDNYLNKAAKALKTDADTFTYVKLLDISIVYEDQEIQPNGKVGVEIQLKDSEDISNPQVVHFGPEPEVLDAAKTGNGVAFATTGFSVYAVVGEGGTGDYARMTVKFYNGENLIDTMYVKNKDDLDDLETILYDPGTGELTGREMFRGWTFNPNYTSADANSHYDPDADPDGLMTIEDIRKWAEAKQITENEEVSIYAMIFTHFTISYVDLPEYGTEDGDISLGTGSLYLARTETQGEYTVSMPYTPHDAFHNFEGWRVIEGAENIVSATYVDDEGQTVDVDITEPIQNGTKLVVKGDITLRVNAPKGNWLVFDENAKGATYNAPQFLEPDEEAVMPDPDGMLLTGYDFAGWFYNKEGTGEAFTGGTISERTTVYAKWTPKTIAPYKYLIYQQTTDSIGKEELGDEDYTLVASVAVDNGTVGNIIPYTFHNNGDEDYVTVQGTDYHYRGFTLRTEDENQHIEITSDGNAVVNLHFDRIKYDLKFYLYRQANNGQRTYATQSAAGRNVWGIAGSWQNVTEGNVPTTTYGPVLRETVDNYTGYYFVLTAYYEEDISKKWPTYDQIQGPNNDATKPVSFIMMNGTGLKNNTIDGNGYGDGRDTIKGVITVMDYNILGATNDADGNYLIIRYAGYNDWTYHIYYEAYEGQDLTGKTTRTLNGKTYYLDHDVASRSSNTYPAQQNPPQFRGFAVVKDGDVEYYDNFGPPGTPQANTTGRNVYLNYYYDRLSYQVNYLDGVYVDAEGNQLESGEGRYLTDSVEAFDEKYAFDADIPENARNYDPTSLVDTAHQNEYVFEGWYFDQACSIPYEWGKMPIDGIKVYAKWRQKQYRVFLHPNVPKEDEEIDWGSETQQMNFRRSYSQTVSLPEGLQEGYEMVGWFKDPECTEVFDESTKMTDGTTSSDYVKTRDWTDPMDKYGNIGSNPTNSDADRFWITRKLDLYAKWRQVLIGALGINVVYDAGDGAGAPTDNTFYLDNAEAVAQGAPETSPKGKVFRYWVLQRWDDSANDGAGAFVDVEPMTEAVPGDTFTVLLTDAHQEEAEGHTSENPKYTYTVQLRAEYVDADELTPTHIDWYNNYISDPQPPEHSDTGSDGKGLKINEAVNIYTPEPREGYQFIGWARVPITESHSRVVNDQRVADLLIQDTIMPFMYLYCFEDEYYLDEEKTTKVTQVAADEETPYHDMYAVWKKNPGLIVKKTDDKGNALNYAYFKLTKDGTGDLAPSAGFVTEDGNPVKDSSDGYKMDSGSVGMTYSNLVDGVYAVTETTPPDGYIMTDASTTVYLYEGVFYKDKEHTKAFDDADYDDGNLIVKVTNTPGQELPNTGGHGTLPYTLGGFILMVSALMYGFRMRRRERRLN